MSKRIIYIEVEVPGPDLPSINQLQSALGTIAKVIDFEELETCAICDGLEMHEEDCPLSPAGYLCGGTKNQK
jgi:hypothetical protein